MKEFLFLPENAGADMNQMFGKKVGMTRLFTESGESVPVTVIEMAPNVVTQVKRVDTDGYDAVQVGIEAQKGQRLTKAETGHLTKAQKGAFKDIMEIRLRTEGQRKTKLNAADVNVGDELKLEGLFEVGQLVDVCATSLGKGFAGVMKRHGMKGFPMTRGTHEYRRHGGSIGCRKTPGRTFKNKHMGGHMGVDRVTQLNLRVEAVKTDDNLLLVRGSIPGPKHSVVLVRTAVKG